jgi:subtilisin family serine protease
MCHESLLARFSADKYRILTADKAVVFASVAEIEAFVSDNSDSIQHYIPVLPTTKIDAGVRQMASEEGGCTAVPKSKEFSNVARLNRASYINRHKKTGNSVVGTTTGTSAQSEQLGAQEGGYPSRKLLVVVAALSPTELQELTHELEDMSKDVNLPFGIPNLEDDLVAGRKSKMLLTVNDCRHIDSIVKKLSHRREVLWIEQYNDVVLHNRWAKGVCQSGDYTSTPMFNANLTGTGEIIGVVDTGLDVTSCYFFDENNKITYNAVNNDHRKVVSYIYSSKYGDKIDDSEGHGTHVAGIVAGRSYKDWGDYKAFRGNAYDAKIAFYDAAIGSASITVPSDITTIFDSLHDAGARIMSNSWGR